MYSTHKKNYTSSTRTSEKKMPTKTVSARADEKAVSEIKKFVTAGGKSSL